MPKRPKRLSFGPYPYTEEGAGTADTQLIGKHPAKKVMVSVVAFGPEIQGYQENERHKACPRPGLYSHCRVVGQTVGRAYGEH